MAHRIGRLPALGTRPGYRWRDVSLPIPARPLLFREEAL